MRDLVSRLKTMILGDRDEMLSIPIMDGALKPNNLLETASVLAQSPGLEDLAVGPGGELYAACGPKVVQIGADGAFADVAAFPRDVTAIAALRDGHLAVGLGASVVIAAGGRDATTIDKTDGKPFVSINALAVAADGSLLVADGSLSRPYEQWATDLMEKGRSGRILSIAPGSQKAATLTSGLEYAYGVLAGPSGQILASESWRHQLTWIGAAAREPALSNLTGYPARMTPAAGGGFWLCVFAVRTQLVEFVLCESDYRREMMRTVDPRYWVAPALRSGADFLEPLQGGGVKQMGILKPWAPPRSYGLVIRIGDDLNAKFAMHSRVGGRNHGIVAVAERGDELFVLSKGAGRILRLSLREISERAGV